jgi:hypothetical protein
MAKDKLTITLTGRAPVTIETKLWPVIASAANHESAARGKDPEEADWKQWLTVRQHADGRAIVYGVHDDARPKESRRAGELITGHEHRGTGEGIPDVIYRVAAYLKFDRDLADKCIANLPAVEVDQAPSPATASSEDDLDSSYRAAAKEEYEREGEIEIDNDAVISHGDDNGAYVAAWVFVYGCKLCKEPGTVDTLCEKCAELVDARAERTGETPEDALEALKLARSLTNALSSALV